MTATAPMKLSPDTPPEHAPALMDGRPYPTCAEPEVLRAYSGGAVVRAFRVDYRKEAGAQAGAGRIVAVPVEKELRIACHDRALSGSYDYRSWNRDWACAVGNGWRATPAEALAVAIEEEAENAARYRRRECAARLALEQLAAVAPLEEPVAPAPKRKARQRKPRGRAPKPAPAAASVEEPAPSFGAAWVPTGDAFLPLGWFVLTVSPYTGPLRELAGAVVAVCREGPITLEGPQEVLRGR